MPIDRDKAAELLQVLLDSTNDFIMIADFSLGPILWNRAYEEVIRAALGMEMKPGLWPHKHLPDSGQVAFWDELHRRVRSGEQFEEEIQQEFPEGVRYFSFGFHPVVREGRVEGFVEISREITDKRSAREALRESERTLRESQEAARIGSYRLDIAGDHWTSSAMLDTIFDIDEGYDRSVQGWSRIVHPEWRTTMVNYFQNEVVRRRKPFDKVYLIARAGDGEERWVHGLGRLRFDEVGDPVEMVGTIRDVTEERQILERLQQQEKMEAIGHLAGGIAHDFNNQITGILGHAELLRARAEQDPEAAELADQIVTSAQRAAELTSQLLAFSRKGKFLSSGVDLHDVIAEVVAVLERTIDKRIVIHRSLHAEPATTVGNPTLLQNAILNLALNARDAMPDGGQLSVSTSIEEVHEGSSLVELPLPLGRYIAVRVSDTGTGMDEETKSRIFEPFYTTKEARHGTGMGLAAAYGTVRSHGGMLTVTSELGVGTTMTMYLPLVEDPAMTIEPRPISPPEGCTIDEACVLVIDDEDSVRRATTAILERAGARVLQCANAASAIEVFRGQAAGIDVVLLDMVMPDVGGRELFREIRSISPDARVILLSGFTQDGQIEELLEEGAIAFLQKPFGIAELTGIVSSALQSGP